MKDMRVSVTLARIEYPLIHRVETNAWDDMGQEGGVGDGVLTERKPYSFNSVACLGRAVRNESQPICSYEQTGAPERWGPFE